MPSLQRTCCRTCKVTIIVNNFQVFHFDLHEIYILFNIYAAFIVADNNLKPMYCSYHLKNDSSNCGFPVALLNRFG